MQAKGVASGSFFHSFDPTAHFPFTLCKTRPRFHRSFFAIQVCLERSLPEGLPDSLYDRHDASLSAVSEGTQGHKLRR